MNNVMKKKGHINPKIHVFIKYASPSNIAKVLFDAKKKKMPVNNDCNVLIEISAATKQYSFNKCSLFFIYQFLSAGNSLLQVKINYLTKKLLTPIMCTGEGTTVMNKTR